jgi:hypothetical protein
MNDKPTQGTDQTEDAEHVVGVTPYKTRAGAILRRKAEIEAQGGRPRVFFEMPIGWQIEEPS